MFSAILIEKTDDKQSVSLAQVDEAQLPEGDVTIDVEVEDAKHATMLMAALRANPSVDNVDRGRG